MNKIIDYHLKGWLFLLPLFACIIVSAQSSEITGELANWVTEDSRPGWIELNPDADFSQKAFLNLLNEGDSFTESTTLELANTSEDAQGRSRYVYQQYYKGIPIENHLFLIHEDQNRIFLAQGRFVNPPMDPNPMPLMDEAQALIRALDAASARQYAWEIPTLEQNLQVAQQNSKATYYPQGTLVWVEGNIKGRLELAWKFDIYAVDPLARKEYFINAKTGLLIRTIAIMSTGCFDNNHSNHAHHHKHLDKTQKSFGFNQITSDQVGTGIANYINAQSGVVEIMTELDTIGIPDTFKLSTTQYGATPLDSQVIRTMNANNIWSYNYLTEFKDVDNVWDTDPAAVGAHWGAQKSFDYFWGTHGRKSFDDNNGQVLSIVHYGSGLVNAYWDGVQLTYGDGNGTSWSALTSLDIIGHEFAHGVTEHNGAGGLEYLDESGALNESFSDIFGAIIEFKYHPDGGDWLVGEDFDLVNQQGFRNMADPHTMGHPKTYLGTNWVDGGEDFGGVHSNSGVQNYWFYLITEGGSDTNEFGHSYNISPIGMDKAEQIAYYTLTHFMVADITTFQDAMNGSIIAANTLYPGDQSVLDAVTQAWCAVGLGDGCGRTITVNTPVLNASLTAGIDTPITWSTNYLPATSKVKIEYTTETGNNPQWNFIADNIANDGRFEWSVPHDYSTTVRIRVSDDGDPSLGRVANKDILGISPTFTIDACLVENSFNMPALASVAETIDFIGNITGSSYEWKIDGQTVATTPNYTHTFSEAGIYEITYVVVSAINNCTNEQTKRLYIVPQNNNGFTLQIADPDNGGGRTYTHDIIALKDGGYLFISLFSQVIFKIDAVGTLVWTSTTLPRPVYTNYRIVSIEQMDGDILIAMGQTNATSENNGTDHLVFLEIDGTDGTLINNIGYQFDIIGQLIPHQIMKTDTSYIIGGERFFNNQKDVFLLQIKANDFSIINQLWIGEESRQDYYGELISTADGGYLMGWFQAGAYPEYYGLMKLDSSFQKEWTEGLSSNFSRPGLRSRMRIVEVPDCEGYLILADADEYANSTLVKVNVLGNVLWAKRYHVPNPTGDQLIAFHDMVWDGNHGVTLLGVNGTQLGAYNYPTAVDYQLLNVNFSGQMQWQRKVTDLDVIIPNDPGYNLVNTKILRTADGGYLTSIPGGTGGPNHLIKMDSMGIDGCVMANTSIQEEDISNSFNINLTIIDTLVTDPIIQSIAAIAPNFENASTVSLSIPRCENTSISPVIAAFTAKSFTLPVDALPMITNLSRGATTYAWKVNGNVVNYPLPAFNNEGIYAVTLEASDGTNMGTTTRNFNIVEDIGCVLPCDLTQTTLYTLPASCPDSEDAGIVSEASSAIGRTFTYNLYNEADSLLATQNSGFFSNLASGNYRIRVISNNEAACFLDLGLIEVAPKVDITPPQALCQTAAVDAAFVHAAIGVPYSHLNYTNELTTAFGSANLWHEMTYEGVDAQKLFSDNYNYIYLEGSDHNADELETFFTTYQQLIENWVAAGNVLFLNAAPNEGDGLHVGFGGVQLVRGTYTNAQALNTSLPMFNGPRTPIGTQFSGTYSLAAVVCPEEMDTTRILVTDNGTDLLVQANWGNGTVLFGGMNLTGFHQPSVEAYNFKINLHYYLKELPTATLNSPLKIFLDEQHIYNLTTTEIDLGSFDDCSLSSVMIDTSQFTCENIGLLDVTLIVTDIANNIATCITQIEVIDTNKTILYENICQGESYTFDGELLTEGGIYRDTLANEHGCDSFVILDLTITDCSFDITCAEDTLLLMSGPIPKGEYWGEVGVYSGMDIMPDSIIFQAGEVIMLSPGFYAPAGSNFTAKIVPTSCESPTDYHPITGSYWMNSLNPSSKLSSNEKLLDNTLQVYPNPFYHRVIIDFYLNRAQKVHLAVYAATGQLVQTLQNEYLPKGEYQTIFDTNLQQEGLYIIVLQTEQEVLMQKVIQTN